MVTGEQAITGVVGEAAAPTTSDQPPAWQCPSFDPETRQRLEQIIENAAMGDYDKQRLFAQMGSTERVQQYEERDQRRVQDSFSEQIEEFTARLRKRMSKQDRFTLVYSLRQFHWKVDEEGITHPAMEDIFRGTYKLAAEEGWHSLAIHLGEEHLHLPAKQLQGMKEKVFYSILVSPHSTIPSSGDASDNRLEAFYGYIRDVREGAKDIPAARQQKFVRKAYSEMIREWDAHKERFVYLFQAALLAQDYDLGREKVLEPIQKYLSFYDTAEERMNLKGFVPRDFKAEDYQPPSYDFLEKLMEIFDLPSTMIHKQMVRLFSIELHGLHYEDTALCILARNILREDEVIEMVNERYSGAVEGGSFHCALGIREKMGKYIRREKVSLEDLRLLAKIEEGVQRNRQ